jgi:hypothetical protein
MFESGVLRKISGHKRKDRNIKTMHRNILKYYMHIAGCKASTKDSLSWRQVAA